MTGSSSTFFWITSRAAGTSAVILASLAVGIGLTMGGNLMRRWKPYRRSLHETLSLSTMVAIAVHGLALLGDTWLHPSLLDITLPFHSSYETFATSVGIVAGWGMVILGLSYYVRKRIGIKRWQLLHRFTAVAWLMGLVHTFTEGTDAGKAWFLALIIGAAAPAMWLLVVRHLRPRPHPTASTRALGTPATVEARG